MAKKTRRAPAVLLCLLDAEGRPLQTLSTTELKLPEDVVLELSELYFNDPEPCHIHRAAVHKRAIMEMMERCPVGESIPIAAMSPIQQRCLAGTGAIFLCIQEEAP